MSRKSSVMSVKVKCSYLRNTENHIIHKCSLKTDLNFPEVFPPWGWSQLPYRRFLKTENLVPENLSSGSSPSGVKDLISGTQEQRTPDWSNSLGAFGSLRNVCRERNSKNELVTRVWSNGDHLKMFLMCNTSGFYSLYSHTVVFVSCLFREPGID